MNEGRFHLRWRLGLKLGLTTAILAALVLAAVTIAAFAQLDAMAAARASLEVERPLLAIVGRLEARQEQIVSLLAPQARADASALQGTVRAAGRDVLAGLQLLERLGDRPGARITEVDARLALLTREYQELERESAALARQRAAGAGEHLRRLRQEVEALSASERGSWREILPFAAAPLAALALVVGVPVMFAIAAGTGKRARKLTRTVDEMTFRVRSGDPPPTPDMPETTDEIGHLAFSLGGLARSLQNSAGQRQHLAAELEMAASHDALTGALSRQRFQELLEAELSRSRRYKGALSLIIFNVDSLERINEEHGSEDGDYVLATIADLVRFNVRKTDRFVRWGGGEFVLLLTETAMDGARHLADKLRRNVEVHPFDRVGNVTVSAGVTELGVDDTRDSFVGRAQDAMQRAKNRGRNRVVAAAGRVEGEAGETSG